MNNNYTDFSIYETVAWVACLSILNYCPYIVGRIIGISILFGYMVFSRLAIISWKVSFLYRFWLIIVFVFYSYFCFHVNAETNSDDVKKTLNFSVVIFLIFYIFMWFLFLKKRINTFNG